MSSDKTYVATFVTPHDGSFAYLDPDTTALPNGLVALHASARAIIVIPERQWMMAI